MPTENTEKKEVVNNKEMIPFEHYLEEYRNGNPQEMADRSKTVYHKEDQTFEVVFLGRRYRITWPDYRISAADGADIYSPLLETNQAKIMVIRFLTEDTSVEGTGKFLTYRDVPWGEVYYKQFNGRCMKRLEFGYGTSEDKLSDFGTRMEKLGARKFSGSADACYEYEVFPGYTVRFMIWLGDDEFAPGSQILFSDNFTSFHPEDLVVVCELMINALKKV